MRHCCQASSFRHFEGDMILWNVRNYFSNDIRVTHIPEELNPPVSSNFQCNYIPVLVLQHTVPYQYLHYTLCFSLRWTAIHFLPTLAVFNSWFSPYIFLSFCKFCYYNMCCFVYVSQCIGVVVLQACVTTSTTSTCSKIVVASEEYIVDWDYNIVKKSLYVYITVSVYFWSLNVHIFLFLSQTPSHITTSGFTVHHSYCNLRNMKKKFSWGKFINILGFQIDLTMFWYSNQSRMTKHSVL